MKPHAKNRLKRLLWIMLLAMGLVMLALALSRRYWIYYQSPSDPVRIGHVRVGGTVRYIQLQHKGITFDLCDEKQCIVVQYEGNQPQMFGEGKQALIDGHFEGNLLVGERILAKHDERYERKRR